MPILKQLSRRQFLFTSSAAALGAAAEITPAPIESPPSAREAAVTPTRITPPYPPTELVKSGPQRTFSGNHTLQIALPIGGIGTGCICLNGYGGMQDFSIRNRPSTTAVDARFAPSDAAFALLHIKGFPSITKLVEGPLPPEKIFDQGLQGQGYRRGGHEGFPRFEKSTFKGEYPFGEVLLTDPKVPLKVMVTGWNPFIPRDDKNSGIPCVILEYKLQNSTQQKVEFQFSYHLSHLAEGCDQDRTNSCNEAIPGQGIFFFNTEKPNAESFGSACLLSLREKPLIKAMWLRSAGWEFDSLSALWREVSAGKLMVNDGANAIDRQGRNGGSILLEGQLSPGESITCPIVITWHFPNCYLQVGGVRSAPSDECKETTGCRALPEGTPPAWRPYYVSQWKDARDVALYVQEHYQTLRDRTLAFKDAFFSSTLPPYVMDAVSANLGIMKSPTVLREENGNLWGWEGCFADSGCCHGSCTHVWNYAQAFPHLFPQLERTLREQELERSMNEEGHVTFRAALPDGPPKHDFHAASDGQLGGIMKVYRDWQISGDLDWLRRMYPLVKRSLDYCIHTWDPNHTGALFEPHHNTYDIEFWGPDGMCTSIYLGALSALAVMARAVGMPDDAPFYEDLSRECARFLDEQLFNGEYYQQKVQYQGLRNTSFAELVANVNENSSEMQRLLKREGPKYQYGSGCLSDGVIGAWMARIYGIETPLNRENVRKTLQAIFKNNFKADLSEHANAQRPGYAMGREPGLLLCSWPNGGKPTLPFVYSDEVWTGIEYQVASHLITEEFVTEGLTIVKALRSRYDGRVRNPWNEYECGNYYARAMASYALLGALSGFRYSAVEKCLWFGPRLRVRPFQSFFSTARGFGLIKLDSQTLRIQMIEGELPLQRVILLDGGQVKEMDWSFTVRPGTPATRKI
jgi:uncharacterized protein (DUF608 family)